MILNNYWNVQAFAESTGFSYATAGTTDLGLKDTSGNSFNLATKSQYSNAIGRDVKNFALKQSLSMVIGSGTTEPALTDYALASPINLSLTTTVACAADGGKISTVITGSGTNTTGSAITVNEIGIVKTNFEIADGSSANYKSAMLVRIVLPEAKVIQAGEGFSFTYTWNELGE